MAVMKVQALRRSMNFMWIRSFVMTPVSRSAVDSFNGSLLIIIHISISHSVLLNHLLHVKDISHLGPQISMNSKKASDALSPVTESTYHMPCPNLSTL